MLQETEIKNNHEICLQLLDKFIEVCEKNNIDYYMAFGSCLGTIRHQGFIPWDINIDVFMMWDDFFNLDKAMKKEDLGRLRWCCPENGPRMFPLLCRDDSEDYESGPNIDVSLYVDAPENRIIRELLRKTAYINVRMFKLKNTRVARMFPFNVLKGISSIIPDKVYIAFAKGLAGIQKGPSSYKMVVLPCDWQDKESVKTEWIGKEPVYGEFEGRKVRIIENCDEYLTSTYGPNYMTPKVWEDKGEYKHVKR